MPRKAKKTVVRRVVPPSPIRTNLGQKVRYLRIKHGLSAEKLARALGYQSPNSVHKIERGGNLSFTRLEALAESLDTTVDYLVSAEKPPILTIANDDVVKDRIITVPSSNDRVNFVALLASFCVGICCTMLALHLLR